MDIPVLHLVIDSGNKIYLETMLEEIYHSNQLPLNFYASNLRMARNNDASIITCPHDIEELYHFNPVIEGLEFGRNCLVYLDDRSQIDTLKIVDSWIASYGLNEILGKKMNMIIWLIQPNLSDSISLLSNMAEKCSDILFVVVDVSDISYSLSKFKKVALPTLNSPLLNNYDDRDRCWRDYQSLIADRSYKLPDRMRLRKWLRESCTVLSSVPFVPQHLLCLSRELYPKHSQIS